MDGRALDAPEQRESVDMNEMPPVGDEPTLPDSTAFGPSVPPPYQGRQASYPPPYPPAGAPQWSTGTPPQWPYQPYPPQPAPKLWLPPQQPVRRSPGARPGRMPREQAVALAERLKRSVALLSFAAFAGLVGLVVTHTTGVTAQQGSATPTPPAAGPSSSGNDSPSGSSAQQSPQQQQGGGFFGQGGGYGVGSQPVQQPPASSSAVS